MRIWMLGIGLLASSAAFAGPFGLEAGQSHSSLGVATLPASGIVTLPSVPNPHPEILGYSGVFGQESGLCRIISYTKDYNNDRYGMGVRGAFSSLKTQLESVYGPSDLFDHLQSRALWDGEHEWVMALHQNERSYQASWDSASGAKLKDGVAQILLTVRGFSSDRSDIHLQYTFSNFRDCEAERNKAGAGSL